MVVARPPSPAPVGDAVARLADAVSPRWLQVCGRAVGLYLPVFVVWGVVYDWGFVVDSDPMFISVLAVVSVVVWLALDALQDAPTAILRLHERGAVGRDDDEHCGSAQLVERCGRAVERARPSWTAGAAAFGALGMWSMMWWEANQRTGSRNPIWLSSMAGEFGWPSTLAILGWVPVGAVVAALFLHVYVVIRLVDGIARRSDLRVLVGHPDGAGGLKPLGDQLLKAMVIGAVPAAFASTWAVLLAADDLGTTMQGLSDRWLLVYRIGLVPMFALLIYPVGVRPILAVRQVMKKRNRELAHSVDELAAQIHEQSVATIGESDPAQLEQGRKTVDGLRDLYSMLFPLPTWPFRRAGVVRFVAALTPPLLSLSGIGDGVVKVVSGGLSSL